MEPNDSEDECNFLDKHGYLIASCEKESPLLLLQRKETSTIVAAKIIDKRTADKKYLEKFYEREKEWMPKLSHPHIISFIELLSKGPKTYLIQEFAENGDLLSRIKKSQEHRLSEDEAKFLLRQTVESLYYIHRRWLIHRDVKCENIFLDKHGNVKLGDFGMIRYLKPTEAARTLCGSLVYLAPEIFHQKEYGGYWGDLYSLGIVLYAMLTGFMPYDDSNVPRMLFQKLHHEINFPKSVTTEARTLIRGLLHPVPTKRYRHCEITHSFFLRTTPWRIKTETSFVEKASAPFLPS